MKLAILSRNSKLYSTRRLVEAARERNHSVRVLDPLRCYLRISSDGFDMHYKGRAIAGYEAVIPRIGASITRYGTAVLRQFEMMGVYTPNSSDAIARARDKLRCHQLLAAEGIGLPVDGVRRQPRRHRRPAVDARPAAARHQAQRRHAGRGRDAGRESRRPRAASIEALRGLYANFLVQEFIAEAKGADLRCFVVGGQVVAAMRRQAPEGDFRSNLHRGGSARPVRASEDEQATAVRAAAVLGLGVAGVDLIRSNRGPLVLEVNSSPGLEGIEAATGVDIAARDHRPRRRRAPRPRAASTGPGRQAGKTGFLSGLTAA